MSSDNQYSTSGNTTIVRRERDPFSGWMITSMVMVILISLGFISLMDLSSQQKKTERDLFELKQELSQRRLSERLSMNNREYEAAGADPASATQRYEELNQSSEAQLAEKSSEPAPPEVSTSPSDEITASFKTGNPASNDSAH